MKAIFLLSGMKFGNLETFDPDLSFSNGFGVGWRHLAVIGLNYPWVFSVFLCAELRPWKLDIKISDRNFSAVLL